MATEYLITTIVNNILKLGIAGLVVYFVLKYFGSFLELKKKKQEQQHKLELYEKVGTMLKKGINLEEAIQKSLSITQAIEQDLKPEEPEAAGLLPTKKQLDKIKT